jgi:hypothetical protein
MNYQGLYDFELLVLHRVACGPALEWGAAVGHALEVLRSRKCVTSTFSEVTLLGRELIADARRSVLPKLRGLLVELDANEKAVMGLTPPLSVANDAGQTRVDKLVELDLLTRVGGYYMRTFRGELFAELLVEEKAGAKA